MDELISLFFNNNSIISIIIISLIVIFQDYNINAKNNKYKITVLYFIFFFINYFYSNIFSFYNIVAIISIIIFILLEFLSVDKFKNLIANSLLYKLLDFIYKLVFEYKFLEFILCLLIMNNSFYIIFVISIILLIGIGYVYIYFRYPLYINNYNKVLKRLIVENKIIYIIIILAVSYIFNIKILKFITIFLILLKIINRVLNNKFEVLDFNDIKKKIDNIKLFNDFTVSPNLERCSKMLVYFEDKSYFIRINSYNFFNKEFYIYRKNRIIEDLKNRGINKYNLFHIYFNRIIKFIKGVISDIKKYFIFNVSIDGYLRGYSTIEMQLIRTLSVIRGYSKDVISRKIYEIIYSEIFFDSLKDYYNDELYLNTNNNKYKYYLIYLYLEVAPVFINNKRYKNIYALFNKSSLDSISLEEFFVYVNGLSGRKISYLLCNSELVNRFNLDKNKLKSVISKVI